jgi:hypothetical protein
VHGPHGAVHGPERCSPLCIHGPLHAPTEGKLSGPALRPRFPATTSCRRQRGSGTQMQALGVPLGAAEPEVPQEGEPPTVVVAVFGTGKNGKSTMINALLGENLLPSGTTTCTGNTTTIGPVENAAGNEIVCTFHQRERMGRIQELGLATTLEEPRVKADWVSDTDITRVIVEHTHALFQEHNVTLVDVPGCD